MICCVWGECRLRMSWGFDCQKQNRSFVSPPGCVLFIIGIWFTCDDAATLTVPTKFAHSAESPKSPRSWRANKKWIRLRAYRYFINAFVIHKSNDISFGINRMIRNLWDLLINISSALRMSVASNIRKSWEIIMPEHQAARLVYDQNLPNPQRKRNTKFEVAAGVKGASASNAEWSFTYSNKINGSYVTQIGNSNLFSISENRNLNGNEMLRFMTANKIKRLRPCTLRVISEMKAL